MPAVEPLKTPLYNLHIELGAKMVPFANYAMPVQYPLGVLKEHNHCRNSASLFDVSHMGQVRIKGTGISAALEKIMPIDLSMLAPFKQSYTMFTNQQGGILDDLIITRWADDEFFLVVNAGCKQQDIAHLHKHLPSFEIEVLEQRALLALQGPQARAVLDEVIPASTELRFMTSCWGMASLNGKNIDCFVSCCGYTGEDGFEISVPAEHATALAQQLLRHPAVEAAGLGARDSLRLEAGLCLYGHDLNPTTTPIEAGLLWSISQTRRAGGSKAGGFPGASKILAQIAQGPARQRVGLTVSGRAPIREGAELVNSQGDVIGNVTSGGFGPTLGRPVAMGYIASDYSALGTQIAVLLRGKSIAVEVVTMPFTPQNYVR